MNIFVEVLFAGLFCLGMGLTFRSLEVARPAKPGQHLFRPGWFTDVCFLIGHQVVWLDLLIWVIAQVRAGLDYCVLADFRAAVAAQPLWLQAVELVVLGDFFIYWGHRLQHRVEFLWQFHAVHHSAEHLDWLAAFRDHPLDTLYTVLVGNLPLYVVGFPLPMLAYWFVFRGLWAVYIHSNVRLPIGPIGLILGSPEHHHWHHDKDRDFGNYGNLSPLMDWLFGTYHCPDRPPAAVGLQQPGPQTYLGLLVEPFWPYPHRDGEDGDSRPVR